MVVALLQETLSDLARTYARNWPFLLFSIVVSALMAVYVNQEQVRRWLNRNRTGSVFVSTAVSVATPLCSCGTTAAILGMMASKLPWAPIVAFMVASPLTSPSELVYSAGLFGWPFALAFFIASIMLGIAGGALAGVMESRGWLKDQARLRPISGGSGELEMLPMASMQRPTLQAFLRALWESARKLLLLFTGFVFVGYLLNNLIPQEWVASLFSSGTHWGVPLAALLGLPFYLNTDASLPLVRAFMDGGASSGAAIAFLITGAGTSVGAIAGAMTIARWRVVGLVIGTLFIGAILFGYGYNLLVSTGLVG